MIPCAMSKLAESFSRLPREGAAISELTLDEIAGLQGWTLEDLAENREGRLSETQKARLLEGHRELFGLIRTRLVSKAIIIAGLLPAYEGVAKKCRGMTMSGPSYGLQLEGLDDTEFFWLDEEHYRGKPRTQSATVLALRLKLLEHWVAARQRLSVYALTDWLIAVEPIP